MSYRTIAPVWRPSVERRTWQDTRWLEHLDGLVRRNGREDLGETTVAERERARAALARRRHVIAGPQVDEAELADRRHYLALADRYEQTRALTA